jgi:peptidoglycan/LPS O-acetylase OafA/YrhL
MAIGALGAVFVFNQNATFKKIAFSLVTQIISWGIMIAMALNKFHLVSIIDNDIVALLTVMLIANVSMNPKTLVRLDFPVLNFLGKISYGIYVYHVLVLFMITRFAKPIFLSLSDSVKYIALIGSTIMITVLLAWLSYEYFEKWFLRKKLKFAIVPSTS